MSRPSRARWASALGALFLFAATDAHATVVERVVAVVGEQAVLLSQLRDRARPFLARLDQQATDAAQRAAATSQLYGQLVQRLVEEELEQKAANRANITVTAREIDEALGRIAQQNSVTVDRVIEEATRNGLSEQSYRQEVRRQLLEAKLLNLRIQGRLRISEDDVRAAYQRLVLEERRTLGFELAWIRVSAPRAARGEDLKASRTQAENIVLAARRGEDFGALARRHSTEPKSASQGGRLGKLKPGQLPPALDTIAMSLDAGSVSEPVRDGDDFVILKVVARDESQLPGFEDAKDELGQRVYMEKMTKAKQHWLNGLKRQTHVEVRL
jgi:peptidyl-prolyl cis-trans isomerase SurA